MDEARFETKLKQMKRQKEQAEEELESASEKWRTERRRFIRRSIVSKAPFRMQRASFETGICRCERWGNGSCSRRRMQEAADEKLQMAARSGKPSVHA